MSNSPPQSSAPAREAAAPKKSLKKIKIRLAMKLKSVIRSIINSVDAHDGPRVATPPPPHCGSENKAAVNDASTKEDTARTAQDNADAPEAAVERKQDSERPDSKDWPCYCPDCRAPSEDKDLLDELENSYRAFQRAVLQGLTTDEGAGSGQEGTKGKAKKEGKMNASQIRAWESWNETLWPISEAERYRILTRLSNPEGGPELHCYSLYNFAFTVEAKEAWTTYAMHS